ncbi:MAG: RDD family protein [Candidatus Aminicenantes bacterium]|nr:RDD family protein [Candidatus Aminicenantes bacterium]
MSRSAKSGGPMKRAPGRRVRPDQAGFFRRGLALGVDSFTVMLIAVAIFFAFSEVLSSAGGAKSEWTKIKEALRAGHSVTIGVFKAEGDHREEKTEEPGSERVYVIGEGAFDLIYEVLVGYTYFILCFRFGGRSLGKRLFGLRVVDLEGRPRLGWYQAFERTHGYAASTLAGSIGFLQVLWDREGLTMHDKIAGTTVIRLLKTRTLKTAKTDAGTGGE